MNILSGVQIMLSAEKKSLIKFGVLSIFFSLVQPASSAYADTDAGYNSEDWLVSIGGSYYDAPSHSAAGDGYGPALTIGYAVSDKWALELLYSHYELDNNSAIALDGGLDLVWLNGLYSFSGSENWQAFLIFGAGITDEIDGKSYRELHDKQANVGIGIFRKITSRFSIRGDIRANYSHEFSEVKAFTNIGVSMTF